MSAEEEQITRKGAVATRIITQAQQRNHQARADFLEARQLWDEVPDWIHHDLQKAVLVFYQALRPLREHKAVEDFWKEVEICKIQTWDRRKNQPVTETIKGFESLEELAAQRTSQEKTISDSFGERTITVRDRHLIDPTILLGASQKLDDAANELGFGPDVDESTPRTEIDDDLMEEVEKWRKANLE